MAIQILPLAFLLIGSSDKGYRDFGEPISACQSERLKAGEWVRRDN
jgi:hypothetical protein